MTVKSLFLNKTMKGDISSQSYISFYILFMYLYSTLYCVYLNDSSGVGKSASYFSNWHLPYMNLLLSSLFTIIYDKYLHLYYSPRGIECRILADSKKTCGNRKLQLTYGTNCTIGIRWKVLSHAAVLIETNLTSWVWQKLKLCGLIWIFCFWELIFSLKIEITYIHLELCWIVNEEHYE